MTGSDVLLVMVALFSTRPDHTASVVAGLSPSTSGRHFIFAFPYPPIASAVRPYLIATAQTSGVQTVVRLQLGGCSQQARVGYREVALFTLPGEGPRGPEPPAGDWGPRFGSELRVERTNDTVVVEASHDITLQCGTANRADRFLVLPSDVMGVEYFVVSAPVARSHQFTVSATRNNTNVLITARFPVFVNGSGVKTERIELELERHSSIHVSGSIDLTGVRVTSDYPLSVVSGSQVGGSVLVQQLPPVERWGRQFALVRSGALTSPVLIYRIVAPQRHTTLSISSSAVTVEARTGDGATWYDHSVPTEDGLDTLSSDEAVMVVRYTLDTTLLITPVELYANSSGFELLSGQLTSLRPVSTTLTIAYRCGQEHHLYIGGLRPVRDTRLRSPDRAMCVRTLAFQPGAGGGNTTVHVVQGVLFTAAAAWVDVAGAGKAGSYRVAATVRLDPPANRPVGACAVSSERPSRIGTAPASSPGEVHPSREPATTRQPNRSADAVVIAPLCASVAIVLVVIAGLCYVMKKNKMLPVCSCKRRRAHDFSADAASDDPPTGRKAAPSPEDIPLQNRYSVSLPDLRPSVLGRELHLGDPQPRFFQVWPSPAAPLTPIAESDANPGGLPARHAALQAPIRHTYFSFGQGPAADRPTALPDPPPQVCRPPDHGAPGIHYGVKWAADRSATGQFASIGRRTPSPAKPIPVQLVFKKPDS